MGGALRAIDDDRPREVTFARQTERGGGAAVLGGLKSRLPANLLDAELGELVAQVVGTDAQPGLRLLEASGTRTAQTGS